MISVGAVVAACLGGTLAASPARARDVCPTSIDPAATARRPLIGSYDGEQATIDSAKHEVIDGGRRYWAFGEGGYRPLQLSQEIKRSGRYAYRFEVGPGDGPKDRMEIVSEHRDARFPDSHHDLWKRCVAYAFSVYIPADLPTPTNWFVFQQVKQHSAKYSPSPNIAWEIRDGRVVVLIRAGGHGYRAGTMIPDPDTKLTELFSEPLDRYRGRWVDFAAEFRLSDGKDGFLAVFKKYGDESSYRRIVRYAGRLGYTGDSDTDNIQIHGGIYRGRQNLTHILYQDDVRIGTRLPDVVEPSTDRIGQNSSERPVANPAAIRPSLDAKRGVSSCRQLVCQRAIH